MHTERCTPRKCAIRISISRHICVTSTQAKKQNLTRSPAIPPQSPDTPPGVNTILISKTSFAIVWAVWNLTVFTLERDCIFLTFRTTTDYQLIYYVKRKCVQLTHSNTRCLVVLNLGFESFLKISQWSPVAFPRVTLALVLLCVWCFGFQGGV